MIRCDSPNDSKRGGVCIYYKEDLALIKRNDISLLNECLVCEIKSGRTKCFINSLYRSPNQTKQEYNQFLVNLDTTCSNIAKENPNISVVLGDFNARNKVWWHIDKTNDIGVKLDDLMKSYNFTQLINGPTNLEPNKTPSCIDLIFTDQSNLILESGTNASLFSTCHHQIIDLDVDQQVGVFNEILTNIFKIFIPFA